MEKNEYIKSTLTSSSAGTHRQQRKMKSRRFSLIVDTEKNHSASIGAISNHDVDKNDNDNNNLSNNENFYFGGPFAHIRRKLDYKYHSHYTKQRQWLQDSIIDKLLNEMVTDDDDDDDDDDGNDDYELDTSDDRHLQQPETETNNNINNNNDCYDSNHRYDEKKESSTTSKNKTNIINNQQAKTLNSSNINKKHRKNSNASLISLSSPKLCSMPTYPWLINVVGSEAENICKSTFIQYIRKKYNFLSLGFVLVNPHEIQSLLPEYQSYVDKYGELYGEILMKKEVGFIVEILTDAALQTGTNVIIYTTLWDYTWFPHYFNLLKNEFQGIQLKIAILHLIHEGCIDDYDDYYNHRCHDDNGYDTVDDEENNDCNNIDDDEKSIDINHLMVSSSIDQKNDIRDELYKSLFLNSFKSLSVSLSNNSKDGNNDHLQKSTLMSLSNSFSFNRSSLPDYDEEEEEEENNVVTEISTMNEIHDKNKKNKSCDKENKETTRTCYAVNLIKPYIDYYCAFKVSNHKSDNKNDISNSNEPEPDTETKPNHKSDNKNDISNSNEPDIETKSNYIEIHTKDISWSTFTKTFQQQCSWKPEIIHKEQKVQHRGDYDFIHIFDVHQSTEMNYRSSTSSSNIVDEKLMFYGQYAHIRKTLDYSYHMNYNKYRQKIQDMIITEILSSPRIVDQNSGEVCTTPTEPFLVFTAGAMGAGKSFTLRSLNERNLFPLSAFVLIDPDDIRHKLPEFGLYVAEDPLTAGELTRKEAGYIVEILTLAALQAGKNVLVDTSLRDCEWYKEYFSRLRKDYPSIKLVILHVIAPEDAVFQRAESRGKMTGRVVPQEILKLALEQVPKSVETLRPLVDYYCKVENAPGEDIQMVTAGITWDQFRSNWVQTCAWIPKQRKKNMKLSPS